MKFEIKQAIVEFKSDDYFFDIEKNGDKPNTARELTPDEIELVKDATHIRIVSSNGQEKFERQLTNISPVPEHIISLECKDSRQLVIFSWKHEDPTQTRNWKNTVKAIGDHDYDRCG